MQFGVGELLGESLVHFDFARSAGKFERVDENSVALIHRQVILRQGARILDVAEILFNVSGPVAQLHPKDADVAAGPALVSREIFLRQFVNGNLLFRLRCRSRLCRRLRGRLGLFFLAAASRQAEDEHAKYGDKHYPVEHGILL